MTHWLEELERGQQSKGIGNEGGAHLEDKIFSIGKNYEAHQSDYDNFINKMWDLTERVNHLPVGHRMVFGQLKARKKENRLNNQFNCFSASRRFRNREFRGLLHPYKKVHYKHIRMICASVSRIMGKAEIEVTEKLLEKKRKDGQLIDEENGRARKDRNKGRLFHQVYYYDVNDLTGKVALEMIDWLAFREEKDHMAVVRDGQPKKREG